jgi:hypothetical protein
MKKGGRCRPPFPANCLKAQTPLLSIRSVYPRIPSSGSALAVETGCAGSSASYVAGAAPKAAEGGARSLACALVHAFIHFHFRPADGVVDLLDTFLGRFP